MAEYTNYHNMREWPYGLLDDLYRDYLYRVEGADLEEPSDLEPSIIYALSTLTDRTREMLIMRYRDRQSYVAIAKEHSVTQERVRQIIQKGLRMLRHPSRMIYIRYGIKGAIVQARKEAAEAARQRAVAEYITSLSLDEHARMSALGQKNLYTTDLAELNLSVRAYNCLRRSGNCTVGDVMRYTADELRRVRNLGNRSYHEIIDVFESIGVNCSKFKEDSDG